MKRSFKLILAVVLLGALLAGVLFIVKIPAKYKWEINRFLYVKREAKKQEFVYHSREPLKKHTELSSPETPNIILISLDTLRAKSMGCYGFQENTTPFIDSLAKEGILFEQMCAAATSTPPSHMSMMTGLYLGVHGVLNKQMLDPRIKTLPEILSKAGYTTGAVTEDGFLVREMGFGRGFDDYYEIKDVVLFDKLLVTGGFAKDVFEKGKSWIDKKINQKFFLFLHTYEVHSPYFPPPPYNTMFLDEPDNYGDFLKRFKKYKGRMDSHQFPPQFIRAQYEGEVRYVDELVEGFISFLKKRGLEGKTLVVVTSDHGEELFEHKNLEGHGYHTYDVETHIPYIMWMPGKIPAGIRVKNQVSNVDILPTLVDLLQLDFKERIQGQSLYPLFHNPVHYDERYVFCEAVNQTCVKSLHYKFIDNKELYLYDSDPEEKFNQAGKERQLVKVAAEKINEFRNSCQSLKTEKGLLEVDKTVNLSEKDINKLKALGYID
jgi:arylsulfatase